MFQKGNNPASGQGQSSGQQTTGSDAVRRIQEKAAAFASSSNKATADFIKQICEQARREADEARTASQKEIRAAKERARKEGAEARRKAEEKAAAAKKEAEEKSKAARREAERAAQNAKQRAEKEAENHNKAAEDKELDAWRKVEKKMQSIPDEKVPDPEPPSSDSYTVREIPYNELQIQVPPIRSGDIKSVHRALLGGKQVALLNLRRNSVDTEAAVFERLGRHPKLTRLLGMSRDPDGNRLLITEYAEHGDLKLVLGKLDEEEGRTACSRVLLQCAMQVCEGMERITAEHLIHRNLALRNVLVFGFDADNPKAVRVKVADYGLTREGKYYYGGKGVLPLRWMSPEAITRRRWTEKSDVWAFGVLMWELWSAGVEPFAFVSSDEEVAKRIVSGEILPKPIGCSDNVYALMKRCWAAPAQRPTFRELRDDLLDLYVEHSRT
uniref:Fibroblast growth factor receptor 1 n=1 Tax=Tetraselmis sp. GSL018 TaxID=582737 RepID=A0A061S910_9CHLO